MGFMNIVFGVVKQIISTLLFPIKPIIDPLLSFGEAMIHLQELLLKIISIVPKLVSIFTMFTDPGKIIKDAIYGVKTGIMMIFDAIFGDLFRLITKPFVNGDNKNKKNDTKEACFNKSFINIIILVLCPPLAIFVKDGFKAIFNIIIASVLTYLYYFPGLIYSCLYIL